MIRRIVRDAREFSKNMSQKNISAFSASTAFFLFLSLIPMLIMLCSILPYTSLTEENLLMLITSYTPDYVEQLVRDVVSEVYARSAGVLSVAVVGVLFSAGKGVLALIRGLNAVNGVVEERNYFELRIVASAYTLIMVLAIVLSLFLMVFGNVIVELVLRDFPQVKLLFELMMNFRFLFSWLILTLVFTMIYAYVPNKKLKFREQVTGGMFSAVVWSTFSWCFSIYVERFNGFSAYGSLTTIVIVMLYFYFCIYIIMIGAYLNSYLNHRGGPKKQWKELLRENGS